VNVADRARLECLEDFRQGTAERIEKINLAWIALEQEPGNQEAGEELARQLHSLKGEAKMMGFSDVSLVAHRTEELVLIAKQRGFDVPDGFGDLILAAADGISALITKKAGTNQGSIDLALLFDRFDSILREAGVSDRHKEAMALQAPMAIEKPASRLPEDRIASDQFLRVERQVVGAFSEMASESVIAHNRYEYAVSLFRQLSGSLQQRIPELELAEYDAGTTALGGGDVCTSSPGISRSSLALLVETQKRLHEIVGLIDQQLFEGGLRAQELDAKARELRLVPVSGLLRKYVRVARDLSSEQGKVVAVDVNDNDVSVDKVVVDKLAEPLLHLVRNSVDHGLETPGERKTAGKAESGGIALSARQEAGWVTVVVEDDGRGIDVEGVKGRAEDLGMLTKEAAMSLPEEEIFSLLFRPGLSTRTKATETSGRGVGLDVVKREVELLGGHVRVCSRAGTGTRFELRVPVAVALSRVLAIRDGDATYAVPSNCVEAVISVGKSDLEMVHNRRSIRFHDSPVPVVSVASVLGHVPEDQESFRALVVRQEDALVALKVDGWGSDTEVIVKPLGELWTQVRLFSGACTFGGGGLALVFNPSELVSQALGGGPHIRLATPGPETATRPKTVLLVEDSTITRAMLARVLAALGYEVRQAEDGRVACELLAAERFDLILTDIEMPRMDGIALINHVRSEAKWRTLPIVVLSTRGSDQDKKRAVNAGADSYLVKTEFSEAAFREAIAQRLGT
jgi:chemotaxis protein histidine kinase CheA